MDVRKTWKEKERKEINTRVRNEGNEKETREKGMKVEKKEGRRKGRRRDTVQRSDPGSSLKATHNASLSIPGRQRLVCA